MVRTRESGNVKAAGAKAARKYTPPAPVVQSPSSDSKHKNTSIGGNPYCPRETPSWQKPITSFFKSPLDAESGSSQMNNGTTETTSETQINNTDDERCMEAESSTSTDNGNSISEEAGEPS